MNEITYKNKLSTIQIEQLNIFKSLEKNILFLEKCLCKPANNKVFIRKIDYE